jgi:hypothetical protein
MTLLANTSMPRLTNTDYLIRRQELLDLFAHEPGRFAVLPPRLQWAVHRYYQTSAQMDDAALLDRRLKLKAREPSLPQVASKAYRRVVAPQPALTFPSPVARREGLTVRGVMQPEIDVQKLAQAFIALARHTASRSGSDAGSSELEEDGPLRTSKRSR